MSHIIDCARTRFKSPPGARASVCRYRYIGRRRGKGLTRLVAALLHLFTLAQTPTMAALTSSAIAPLRVSAAKPAAGRKVRKCTPAGGRDRARALALTAAPLCARRRPTDRVRARGHAQAGRVRARGAGRRCAVCRAPGCPARVRREHVRSQPHRCVQAACALRPGQRSAAAAAAAAGKCGLVFCPHILVKAGRLTRPRDPAACVKGVTFTEVQKPTAAAAGDASSAVSGACTGPRLVNNLGAAWVCAHAPISAACLPARPRARRNTHPARRRGGSSRVCALSPSFAQRVTLRRA